MFGNLISRRVLYSSQIVDVNIFSAKCTVIVRLLNFLTALWTKYPQDTMRAIDSSFYSHDLTKLILICVFNPTQLGFDINNEEINKKLPERVCLYRI
jgi:hypothetical protein